MPTKWKVGSYYLVRRRDTNGIVGVPEPGPAGSLEVVMVASNAPHPGVLVSALGTDMAFFVPVVDTEEILGWQGRLAENRWEQVRELDLPILAANDECKLAEKVKELEASIKILERDTTDLTV